MGFRIQCGAREECVPFDLERVCGVSVRQYAQNIADNRGQVVRVLTETGKESFRIEPRKL